MILTSLYAKSIFKDHIFPCYQDKSPKLKKGQSWKDVKFTLQEIEEIALAGLRCGIYSRLVVVDIDTYKEVFMKSEKSKAFRFYIRKHCHFWQKTQSGGEQYFFLMPEGVIIKSRNNFLPGVDIKAEGGYVCIYNNGPLSPEAKVSSYEEFLSLLTPLSDLSSFSPKQDESKKSKSNYVEGNRNTAFNRDVYIANKYEDVKRLVAAIYHAKKSDLPKDEVLTTLYHKFKNFYSSGGGGDDDRSPKTKDTKGLPKLGRLLMTQKVNYISKARFPGGAMSIIAGLPGKGKTNFVLKVLTMNKLRGDGRPFLFYTQENSISNVVMPRVIEYGGENNENNPMHIISPDQFPEFEKYKSAEGIPARLVAPWLQQYAATGLYSAVVLDPGSLFMKDDENKSFEKGVLPFLNALHPTTSLIVTAQILKDIKGKELLHHVRGPTDFTGMARKVFYLREGKEDTQRIVVVLKDSYTGNSDTGFLLEKETATSDMEIKEVYGSYNELLDQYGKPLVSHNQNKESIQDQNKTDLQISEILTHYSETLQGKDFIYSTDMLNWIMKEFSVKLSRATKLLKKSGLISVRQTRDKNAKYIIRKQF